MAPNILDSLAHFKLFHDIHDGVNLPVRFYDGITCQSAGRNPVRPDIDVEPTRFGIAAVMP
jgi:hypothetical protein